MKALCKTRWGGHGFDIQDWPEPSVREDEVVVQTAACGLCGTDLSMYRGDDFESVHPAPLPRVLGHEFCGPVVQVGRRVSRPVVGEWVAVNPHLFDGTCRACSIGQEEECENRPIYGVDRPGGAAEFVAVRARNAHVLPADVGQAVGALAEPLAVAIHSVQQCRVRPGEKVAIIGPGPIGLMTLLACQEAGAEVVLLVGLPSDTIRLAIGARLGTKSFVTSEGGAVSSEALAATSGRGLDCVIDASGSSDGTSRAFSLTRPGGRVGLVGLIHSRLTIRSPMELVLLEKSLITSRAYTPRDWIAAIALLGARRSDIEPIVTHRLPLEQWPRALSLMNSRRTGKVLLIP